MFNVGKIIQARPVNIQCQIQKTVCANMSNDTFASKNLLHFLKKRLRSTEEIEKFISRLSDEEKYIGELPDRWRQKFRISKLDVKTKQIQHLFSSFADSAYCMDRTKPEMLSKNVLKLSQGLEEILGEKCKITFAGKGSFGKVFRIECAGEDLALKIFHSNNKYWLDEHGATKEIANAVALNYCLKPSQCARFYCAKVTANTDSDAFMLSQFVKNDNKPSVKEKLCNWIYKKFDFGDAENEGNSIGGKITDFGDISYMFKNQEQYKFAKKLYPLIIKGDEAAIIKMKEKYSGNKNFQDMLSDIIAEYEKYKISNPSAFGSIASEGVYTKEEITALRAIGVDFSRIEKFDYSGASKEIIQALKELGLSIKH